MLTTNGNKAATNTLLYILQYHQGCVEVFHNSFSLLFHQELTTRERELENTAISVLKNHFLFSIRGRFSYESLCEDAFQIQLN